MASKEEISKNKELVVTALNRQKDLPKTAIKSYMNTALMARGKDCSNLSLEQMQESYKQLKRSDRHSIDKGFKSFSSELSGAYSDFKNGKTKKMGKLPGKLREIILAGGKGVTAGIGAAGIANMYAPGLFSTLAGYLTAKAPDLAHKLGLAAAGIFTPQIVSNHFILGAGAIAGAILFTGGKTLIELTKSVFNKLHKNKNVEIGE